MQNEKIIQIHCDVKDFIKVGEVTPLQGNLKNKSKADLEKLKGIIIRDGFVFPLFVARLDKKNYTLDGHGRDEISIQLKQEGFQFKKIGGEIGDYLPVVFINAENKKDAKTKLLYLNSRYGKITEEGLNQYLNEAGLELDFASLKLDIDLPEINLNGFENKYYSTAREELDEIPEVPKKALSRKGDLFVLNGKHRVLCGDSTEKADVARLMGLKKANIIHTDPPYGVKYTGGTKKWEMIKNDSIADVKLMSFLDLVYENISQHIEKKCSIYVWFAGTNAPEFMIPARVYFDISYNLIWNKNHAQFGNIGSHYKTKHEPILYMKPKAGKFNWHGQNNLVSVLDYDRKSKNEFHPNEKPTQLVMDLLSHGSLENELVLDLFLGSGTTIVAAEEKNRIGYGMELDPRYMDVILKRYRKLYPDKTIECETRKFNFNKLFNENGKKD